MSTAILSLHQVSKKYGNTISANNLNLAIRPEEFFTLLGPSGSGKSTVLRMIAGLETPDSGDLYLNGVNVTSTPPWERHIGMVFQHYANFPHMNVEQNVGYGLRRANMSKADIKRRVAELLELVGMGGFESRRVTNLSGGEQQRIAIARALAPQPAILLLDEPLSALDEKIRREMQDELRNIQQQTKTTFIYVTHDQEEALTMSDRVAVLNRGDCVQCDAPEQIFRFPRTEFVARFFRGNNVIDATVTLREGGNYEIAFGNSNVVVPVDRSLSQTRTNKIAVRSEALMLGEHAVRGDMQVSATIEKISYRGIYTAYTLRLPDGQHITASTTQHIELKNGDSLEVGIAASDIVILEQEHA